MSPAPVLSERLGTRDNAVTLLRLGLALLVVAGHAYEIGGFGPDPLFRSTGVTLGELAVNGFFALSGYLVAQSWCRSRGPGAYLLSRCLRIFPGFWICLAFTGLALFPAWSARVHGGTWLQALEQPAYWGYPLRNALLRVGQASVADLFAHQPAMGVANGSLWTLLPEFSCYLAVALAGTWGWLRAGRTAGCGAAAAAAWAAMVGGPRLLALLHGAAWSRAWYLWRVDTQAAFFAAGVLACVHGSRLRVGAAPAAAALALLAVAAKGGAYAWTAPVLWTYALLQLAVILPGAWLERVGDYSYGLYLYHYPLAQVLIGLGAARRGPGELAVLTTALALPLAAASWRLVERPALSLKRAFRRGADPGLHPA